MAIMDYDSWLEAPYHEAAERSDAFVSFCEAEGLDPDDAESDDAFIQHLVESSEAAAEAAAEAKAEARADRELDFELDFGRDIYDD